MAIFARCTGSETSVPCDFDLCMKCAGCPKNHLLLNHSSVPQCILDKFPQPTEIQLNCDKCGKTANKQNYYRCHEDCDFDVCLGCGPFIEKGEKMEIQNHTLMM